MSERPSVAIQPGSVEVAAEGLTMIRLEGLPDHSCPISRRPRSSRWRKFGKERAPDRSCRRCSDSAGRGDLRRLYVGPAFPPSRHSP